MIDNDWDFYLNDIYKTKEFKNIINSVKKEYETKIIYPLYENIFNALKTTSYENTKVVIIGQDPYHEPFEAHGYSFSVQNGIKLPPSLKNIFKELKNDLNIENNVGDLTKWAKEGVLLLNSILTVEEHVALSHKNLNWEYFTDNIIKILNEKQTPIVFILWGAFAKKKSNLITNKKHLIISSVHPSPLSAYNGFFGSKPFSKTNNFLIKNNIKPINFKL